ncbi:MAG: four helix bundle protein [Bacteroidetes bacterium]|nr:four helix bundle protein [Bacteroidota bacterium]MCW5895255.1 four helix bundle protein [Bacteroidota bacterium]
MLRLEELEVYQMAMDIGEDVWKFVDTWEYFAKRTIGGQLVESADSIAANISEGFGRYHYKENRQFCYYARGSLMETKTWLMEAKGRNFISEKRYDDLIEKLKTLHLKLNSYIKSIGRSNPGQ